jgi:lipopolysaccharide transport protein LptA
MTALAAALALLLCAAVPGVQPSDPAKPARKKPGQGQKKTMPERPVKITSDTFEVFDGERKFVWKGHVLAVRDDLKIDCDQLVGDYDEQKHLKTLTCIDHVHMLQAAALSPPAPKPHDEREAWGDLAVFDNDTSVLTVTGKPQPRGRDGKNRMRGDQIIFESEVDKLRAEGHVVMDLESEPKKDTPPPQPARDPKSPEKKK